MHRKNTHKDAGISHCGVRQKDIFNKQSASLWVLIVRHYLPACFYTRMYEAVFVKKKKKKKKKNQKVYRWCTFGIKNTTETPTSASYLDCYLYSNNGKATRLYDKQDDFNFPIVNFPFLSSHIPSAPAYGVYVSQLIRYARACTKYQDFIKRGKLLTTGLFSQGYQRQTLLSTLKKLYGRRLVTPFLLGSMSVRPNIILICHSSIDSWVCFMTCCCVGVLWPFNTFQVILGAVS